MPTIPEPTEADLRLDLASIYARLWQHPGLAIDLGEALIRRLAAAEAERAKDADTIAVLQEQWRRAVEATDATRREGLELAAEIGADRDRLIEVVRFAVTAFCDPAALDRDPAAVNFKAMADAALADR